MSRLKEKENERTSIFEVYSTIDHLNEEKIQDVVKNHKCIDKWAYIIHDKDIYTEEDIKELKVKNKHNKKFDISKYKVGQNKEKHIHFMGHMNTARTYKDISKWFDVPVNYINPPREAESKTFAFRNMVAYLVHSCKNKYQYNIEEVKSHNVNVEKMVEDYKKANAKKEAELQGIKNLINAQKKQEKEQLEEILLRISQGEIRDFNIKDYMNVLFYTKYKTQIDRAFSYRAKTLIQSKRDFDVYFFEGPSRSGKSSYAELLAKQKGFTTYIASSSNDPLNFYSGQDCIIMNDLRGSTIMMADLLTFLDPHSAGTGYKSRFVNKLVEAKLIIITSPFTIKEFYEQLQFHNNEPIKQLKARCKMYCHFSKEKIKIEQYDETEEDYISIGEINNPIKDIFPQKRIDYHQKMKSLKDFQLTDETIKEARNKSEG